MNVNALTQYATVTAAHAVKLARRSQLGLPKAEVRRGLAAINRRLARRVVTGYADTSPIRLFGHTVHFLNLDNLDLLFAEIFLDEDYYFEAETPAPTVIDCGSNIGMSVLYFKTLYPRARIVGFEPMPEVYDVLRRNIEGNGLQGVEVHNRVLAAAAGTSAFYFDPTTPGSLLTSSQAGRVPNATRLDIENAVLSDYIAGPVDLLKMDIEGAEWEVLGDLQASGTLDRVKALALEYHHHIGPEDDRLSAMLRMLEDAGFGYLIGGRVPRPRRQGAFQDIMVYAYRKEQADA